MTGPIEPTLDEYNQSEPAVEIHPPVSVTVQGPVKTQIMPSVASTARVFTLPGDGAVVQVGNRDPRRKRLLLICTTGPFAFATDRGECQGDSAALWPQDVPLSWEAETELFACVSAGSDPETLTAVYDGWTE